MQVIWVAIGGALGSVLRFLLQSRFQAAHGGSFPIGTLSVNLIGSLIIGFIAGWFLSAPFSNTLRIFLMVGVLGGFTTFSSFALENLNLLRAGNVKAALVYMLASNVIGIGLAWAGFAVSRLFARTGGV